MGPARLLCSRPSCDCPSQGRHKDASNLNGKTGSQLKSARWRNGSPSAPKLTKPTISCGCDGSEEERDRPDSSSRKRGVLIPLNHDKRPTAFYIVQSHDVRAPNTDLIALRLRKKPGQQPLERPRRDLSQDARMVWTARCAGARCTSSLTSMGPAGSPFQKSASRSATRLRRAQHESHGRGWRRRASSLGSSDEFTGTPCTLDLIPTRLICHFPRKHHLSCGSGYGGNALLSRNVRAWELRAGRQDRRMARRAYADVASKVPRRNHLLGPRSQRMRQDQLGCCSRRPAFGEKQGWKVFTLGDDIAWSGRPTAACGRSIRKWILRRRAGQRKSNFQRDESLEHDASSPTSR